MVPLKDLPLLALGIVVSAGVGFLFWTLYHLAKDAHTSSLSRREH